MKSSRKESIVLTILVLIFGGYTAFTCLSLLSHTQAHGTTFKHHLNPFDMRVAQARAHYMTGDVAGALALEAKACHEAGTGVSRQERRAQLNGCAMDYCNFKRRDKAIALLRSIPPSTDDIGQQTAQLLAGILRNEPAFRGNPVPNKHDKAHKAAPAQERQASL